MNAKEESRLESTLETWACDLLRRQGWTPTVRQKPSGRYLQARKWQSGERRYRDVYISAISRLYLLHEQDILKKLKEVDTHDDS